MSSEPFGSSEESEDPNGTKDPNQLSELRVDDCQAVLAFDVGHVCDAEQTAYLVLGNLQRPG
jgi:hypothetical protein